jgi:hypothetical protein
MTALTNLESGDYHQSKKAVDDYIDKFSELVDEAGCMDGLSIVMKFWKGLDRNIQDQIAEMVNGRPADNDPEGWYHAMHIFDANRTANQAFHGAHHTLAPILDDELTSPIPKTPSLATPAALNICGQCGEPGPLTGECPKAHDIRYMTLGEREDWLNQVFSQADIEMTEIPSLEFWKVPWRGLKGKRVNHTPLLLSCNQYAPLEVDSVEDDPETSPDPTNETMTTADVQSTHTTIPSNSPSPPALLGAETPSQVCGRLHPFGEFPTP